MVIFFKRYWYGRSLTAESRLDRRLSIFLQNILESKEVYPFNRSILLGRPESFHLQEEPQNCSLLLFALLCNFKQTQLPKPITPYMQFWMLPYNWKMNPHSNYFSNKTLPMAKSNLNWDKTKISILITLDFGFVLYWWGVLRYSGFYQGFSHSRLTTELCPNPLLIFFLILKRVSVSHYTRLEFTL